MIRTKIALALTITALAGSALGQANASGAEDARKEKSDAVAQPWKDYQVENAALLYYRYWMIGQTLISEELTYQNDTAPGGRPTEEYAAALKAGQQTIRGYLKASRGEHVDWGIEYEEGIGAMLPHLGKLRHTARILSADAIRLLDEGEVEQAAERLAAIYRMGEQTSQDRVLISSLVGIAITSLANNQLEEFIVSEELTHEAREIILKSMDVIDLENPAGVRDSVLGERDIFLGWTVGRHTGPNAGAEFIAETLGTWAEFGADEPSPWHAKIALFDEAQLRDDIKKAERYYSDILSIWDLPDGGDRISQMNAFVDNGHYGVAGRLLLPAMGKIWESHQRIRREVTEVRELLEDAPVVKREDKDEDDD